MAFTNFYMDASGSNVNAGSVITAAASVTNTNGGWSTVTNIFTPSGGGTPFSGVSAGEYASIYVDAASVTTFVGKIATVNGGGATITIDATLRMGTAPTTSATARSCKIGGSWVSEIVLAATGLGTTTMAQPTKINCNNNITHAASRTISMAGSTTNPLWISGYNANPGDLDSDTTNTLAKPVWTIGSTFQFTLSGAHVTFSGFDITGTRTSALCVFSAPTAKIYRCRFENTNSNANTFAMTASAQFYYCWFKSPTTATTTGVVSCQSTATFTGCVVTGGGIAGFNCGTVGPQFLMCAAIDCTGAGWLCSTGVPRLLYCTVRNPTADGIKWTGTPSSQTQIVGCLFVSCPTGGINNASGTNTNLIQVSCCDFYNCGTTIIGFGDAVTIYGQTDSADPTTSATDMTPLSTSNAFQHGFPGIFENQTYSSFASIGAVMPQGGSGMLFIPVE